MSGQTESWVLEIIFGTDYQHAFYIFSMKIPLLGMEMVKIKQEVEPWGLPCLLTFCEIPFFFLLIFENISAKANGRRVDIYHINVTMFAISWNYLKFSCNLIFFENQNLPKTYFQSEQKLKFLEDSMILALGIYILVYHYLIFTCLLSYFFEFC